jgi:hypothetical protein
MKFYICYDCADPDYEHSAITGACKNSGCECKMFIMPHVIIPGVNYMYVEDA